MPYLSKKIYLPFHQLEKTSIYDLGGNDLGAKVMRQFDREDKRDVDLFLVLNVYREETRDEASMIGLIKKLENSSGFKVTGLINNSNLLRETTYDDIMTGEAKISSVAKKTGIPIVYTSIYEELYDEKIASQGETLILKLYFRKTWY